jgi:hypothetical protein
MKRQAGWSLAALLCVAGVAEAQSLDFSSGGIVASLNTGVETAPRLGVVESVQGWTVVCSGLEKEAPAVLLLGTPAAPGQVSTVYFGVYGSVHLEMVYLDLAFLMTPSDPGAAELYFPKPRPIPPELRGFTFVLQAVEVLLPVSPVGSQVPETPPTLVVSDPVSITIA